MARLNHTLYQAQPFIHVAGGSTIALTIGHPAGIFGGLMMVAAGLLVFYYRISHRIQKHDMKAYGRCVHAHTCHRRTAEAGARSS